ncbi:hypothetical protein AWM68_02145 [Fictibacillus phosphorivorans]|uniref:DUF4386 family protein n=1 Tax=Fictibacillus phosphorivorans TaxID=1221500 RepID=A0A163SH95_9BACL|nr:hypothetical protein [Fictibacillus phosphorivorans]KZE69087.1 hypothetical protein AWM68_02145 [Fictibacillus phosphorivorans]
MQANSILNPISFIRLSGLFLTMAGIAYIVIQFIHPVEEISSISKNTWVVVAILTMIMSLFNAIGITGIYTGQIKESGWLGLIGFIMFVLFWLLSMTFSFVEAFILPLIVNEAPKFVEGFLSIFGEVKNRDILGVFPSLAPIAGIMYVFGGLLFGIATYRAKKFSRMASIVLSVSSAITILASVIPHPYNRLLAIPMGIALIYLGCSVLFKSKETFKS